MEVSSQFHDPAALPPGERAPGTHWIGGWVGLRVGFDAVERRQISGFSQDSNPDPSTIQPVASRYTDWAILAP
jgi:hypothetical protein